MAARRRPDLLKPLDTMECRDTVDIMLMEGTSPAEVARYLHDDLQCLLDVPLNVLTDALGERRLKIAQSFEEAEEPIEDATTVCDEDGNALATVNTRPVLPTHFARAAYRRAKGGIHEMIELEALYVAARNRLDRALLAEANEGVFSPDVSRDIAVAADLLVKRVMVREKLGLVGASTGSHDMKDFTTYSTETAKTLQQPESRRRVLNLVDRLKRLGKFPSENEGDDDE